MDTDHEQATQLCEELDQSLLDREDRERSWPAVEAPDLTDKVSVS